MVSTLICFSPDEGAGCLKDLSILRSATAVLFNPQRTPAFPFRLIDVMMMFGYLETFSPAGVPTHTGV
jgi:hypothetical protein